jgi:mono/diheme cytochrome c family protein
MAGCLGRAAALAAAVLLASVTVGVAADLAIEVGSPRTLASEALLARPDAATIDVPADVSFGRAMRDRAVPLRALLGVAELPAGSDLQLTATDGFVTNLPGSLVFPPDPGKGAVPWLAIEPPGEPWPPTPAGSSAGPFYLVWLDPAASGVRSEQWSYAVDAIRVVAGAAVRWPELAVGDEVPADSPIRHGMEVMAVQCLVCHRLDGAGDATVGPDLGRPHGPTEYLQPWALRQLIRDPSSVRAWPDMRMPGFPPDNISDADLDAAIAYLGYMAGRK